MSNLIGIVNYGLAGNIHSIKKAIEKVKGNVIIIDSPEDFSRVDKLVIPGVGSFKGAMQELNDDKFINAIINFDNPVLGICLGMQIMAKFGFEYGKTKGLGLIDAEVKLIVCEDKIPHVGFNNINVLKENKLLKGLEDDEFYFMHSYEIINHDNVVSTSTYSNYEFVSSVQKDNFFGVQFHPEKSREAGLNLFKNFIEL